MHLAAAGMELAVWGGLAAFALYALYVLKWAMGIDLVRRGGPHLPIPGIFRPLKRALAPLRARLRMLVVRARG
jgi:hypothetical protein